MEDHATLSVTESLKSFAQNVTTSSTNKRLHILGDLVKCCSTKPNDVPENAVRGILKYLMLTLGRYHDLKSRHAVTKLVEVLTEIHPETAGKQAGIVFAPYAESLKKCNASRSSSGEALVVLSWTCVIMSRMLKQKDGMASENIKPLVSLQCDLVYGALASGNKNIVASASRKLRSVWTLNPDIPSLYISTLNVTEPSVYNICLYGQLMKYFTDRKLTESIQKYKVSFLEQYLKQVVSSRTRPGLHVLESCKYLLRHVTHAEFKGQVLPAAQKAMLRSPEIILQTVDHLLHDVQLDLSTYTMDIGKQLAAQLCSKELSPREEAAQALRSLAHQCSDAEAVEKLATYIFKVLSGSSDVGKLTVVDQRIGVLHGIGSLSYHTVNGPNPVQNLSASVCEQFLPFLQQEVHEGTLVQALSVMSSWCARFYTSIPEKLIQWFKNALALKSSTSAVRNAYIQCMNIAFKGDTLHHANDLLPALLQTLEKARSQSSQIQLVIEAVSAANILSRLSLVDIQAETKLGPFWKIVLDMDKKLFVNEKFLSSIPEEAMQTVASLSERLIVDYPQRITDHNSGPFYRALVLCLLHKSWSVRRHARSSVKKIISLLEGGKLSLLFVREFAQVIASQKAIDRDFLANNEVENHPDIVKYISPKILAEAVTCVCSISNVDPNDAVTISRDTLITAHHPCITIEYPNTWTDIVQRLHLDAKNFITSNLQSCLPLICSEQNISKSQESAISTMFRIAPDCVMPALIEHVSKHLDDPELLVVTHEEYEIFQLPEGELYDKSFVDSLLKSEVKESNIKRENKMYSYAEQMAEIELRKEMDAKRGKTTEVKLTKKQEEQVQLQLQKESEIRDRLRQLNVRVSRCCTMLEAAIIGDKHSACFFMTDLCQILQPLLKSPLAAPSAYHVMRQLGIAAFQEYDANIGLLISHTTLRLCDPHCQQEKGWTDEPLAQQTVRATKLLYNTAVESETSKAKCSRFPAFTFAFFFNLLNAVLRGGASVVKGDNSVCTLALQLICEHGKLKYDVEQGEQYNPRMLPLTAIINLLIYVIGTSTSRIQNLANDAMIAITACFSEDPATHQMDTSQIDAVLLALLSPCASVRSAGLQALNCLGSVLPDVQENYEMGLKISQRLWVASHDVDDQVREQALGLQTELGLDEPYPDLCLSLIEDVTHGEEIVRIAAASTLAVILKENPAEIGDSLKLLMDKYEEKLYMPPPVLDNFGRLVSEQPPDLWPARSGIAMAICKMAPHLPQEEIETLFSFLVPKALGDRNTEVRTLMREAALATINDHGKDNVSILLPVFEDFLANAPDTASYDSVRQSVVILMGSLAKHLDKDNPKVKPIVAKLISALSTPSQEVQQSVANCLPPLVQSIKQDAAQLVQRLLNLLLESDIYGERKGAAYGLAGLIKGLGLMSLKQLEVMSTLEEAVQDKKNPRRREGALFAFEMLCTMLGKLFEPYVVKILPHLLLSFGDTNQYVREAADDTAKAVMKNLSAQGVKLVLPSLLQALEEDSWRTKTGSVELLGAMAYCAPKQLSNCLPSIVPKLTEVLTDSHAKVNKAGAQALRQIGSVIKNPEIQALVPILLDALQEPSKKTTICLQILLETKFVHFIDAPSLALILPVVERAFKDRTTETKKMACQIIGNMYSLTDQKDLAPYLPSVMPGMKQALLDPVPEVRNVSSRALGAMVKGMGENSFADLLPWLKETLVSERSSVDRSGAAQGLSEVIGGMGLEKLHVIMPDIIREAEKVNIAPHVRDGYIMMYIYLPPVFEKDFMPYIAPILPSILKALADESEFVRDTALKAGQRIINMYADTAIELLLPQLENGLFDDNWRIRYSSVQLLGDLLYKVSGVSGKMSTESAHEDDNFGTASSQQAIFEALGDKRRNRVLAGLYMGRSDTALMVRQSALHVWKVIVSNTPRTLREILSTLFTLLLGCLASNCYDKRQVAARTLGDLVRKLGERVLPEIIPILEKGLDSDQDDQRQGVCIGLSEIMASTSREHVTVFADSLIPTVRRALCDRLPKVREAAAHTFDNLHSNIGARALDEILPKLLKKLGDPVEGERALDGLKQVMAVKSRVVLPYLIPQLTCAPVNTRALSFLSVVAGDNLSRHLGTILPALLSALSSKADTPEEAQELQYCETVVLSVSDDLGVRTIIDVLLAATSDASPTIRYSAVTILNAYCRQTKANISDYHPQLFRGLISLFVLSDAGVLLASWECLDAITKKLDSSELLQHISNIRQAVRFATSDFKGKEFPGFSIPKKGITPVLPIFREGILNGSPEMKESAAFGLGEVITLTSAEALKPSVLNITGPLIRILGDRFTWNVKVAILQTLTLLLAKVGVMLKPFLPQLQTTFVKALNDPNRTVRLKAAAALGKLSVIHTRVDPLFIELHTGVKNADETSIRDTMLQALRSCIMGAGAKISDAIRKQLTSTLLSMLTSPEDSTRMTSAGCLGALCLFYPDEERADVLIQNLLDTDTSQDWMLRHGRSLALAVALKEATDKLCTAAFSNSVKKTVLTLVVADRIPICLCGLRGAAHILIYQLKSGQGSDVELLAALAKGLKHDSNEVKQLSAKLIMYISLMVPFFLDTTVHRLFIPMLVNGTKEKNTVVKSNSEYALIALLHLKEGDSGYKEALSALDPGMQDSLTEVYSKSLRRMVTQQLPSIDDIDDTVLK